MRKHIILALILIAGLATSCNKLKSLTNINESFPYSQSISIPYLDTTLQVPPGGLPVSLSPIPLQTNSKSYLSQYNTSSDKVNSVTLKSLAMQVTQPPGGNFNFLDSVQVFISADSLPDILVAYDYNIPKGTNIVNLTTTNTDMKKYFLKDTMYVRVYINANSVPGRR